MQGVSKSEPYSRFFFSHRSIVVTPNFLPDGPLTIGVTSGASTPDAYLQEAIERLFLLRSLKGADAPKKDTVNA